MSAGLSLKDISHAGAASMAVLFEAPSTASVTEVVWITSVRDAAERAELNRYIDDVQPALLARNVPFEGVR
jgi:hypothetical protein